MENVIETLKVALPIAASVYGLANIIVRLTPTPKDDKVVGVFGKVLYWIDKILTESNRK